jgi:GT2 family glycosyltransferase
MAEFSIVIPSRKAENLVPCVQAVLKCEPDLDPSRIIVIDDGARPDAEGALPGVTWIAGVKPFIFARNVNLGIVSVDHDVILLNDDALLKAHKGFSALSEAAQYRWGLVSASTNCGNVCQEPQGFNGVREDQVHCPSFICVYIPRETIRRIGPLDERFVEYGWEDNDYVRRTRNAGLRVGIFDHCFVDHMTLHSSFRGKAGMGHDIRPGWKIYQDKWGQGAI